MITHQHVSDPDTVVDVSVNVAPTLTPPTLTTDAPGAFSGQIGGASLGVSTVLDLSIEQVASAARSIGLSVTAPTLDVQQPPSPTLTPAGTTLSVATTQSHSVDDGGPEITFADITEDFSGSYSIDVSFDGSGAAPYTVEVIPGGESTAAFSTTTSTTSISDTFSDDAGTADYTVIVTDDQGGSDSTTVFV